jgi:iron complex transport system ATP-binding protein
MQKVIEIRNVTAYRGDTLVFENFSLELRRGRNTVILGPNGAGKTTLLKLLSRELYPVHRDDSAIRIFGQENWNVWDLRAQLGIVSHDLQHEYAAQAKGLYVILSGFYASVGIWAHQEFTAAQIRRADEVMDDLGITSLADRTFAHMSTGQQRRFLLGRALVNDPHTLVLDEPTSGLDLQACFHYLDVIRGLMRAGKTVILVTHHIHEIPPEIAHAILMKDGSVLAQGEKSAVLTNENLSRLFGVRVQLVQASGFYQVIPG